jgi:hypothetical protein
MERQTKDALASYLIDFLKTSKAAAERYASQYVRSHPISAHQSVNDYVQVAVDRMATDAFEELCGLTRHLDGLIFQYSAAFQKEPYLGLPIGELSLFDQITVIQSRIECLTRAISSRIAIPDEPEQQMSPQDPLPVFCTGSNHCSVASMLSLISYLCKGLGYTGNAPPRSFSIILGDAFKGALGIRQDRCIVIEEVFRNLDTFLQLLREHYPPYAPFLDRIFTLFSSRTFSRNADGTCSLHSKSKEVISSLNMLEESTELLGNRLQHAFLSCGSEQCHPHLQMKLGVISAFGLPCASLDIDSVGTVLGLLPQIPFTAIDLASFQLVGNTVDSYSQFEIRANLFAAVCDTRGRNQHLDAGDAHSAGTSHYYLVICTDDGRYFCVDSSRTAVQEISQEDFLRYVNDNGIVIFMRNRVEHESFSSAPAVSSNAHDCLAQARLLYQANAQQLAAVGGGAAAVPSTHLTEPRLPRRIRRAEESRQFSAGGGAAAIPVVAVQSSDSSRSLLQSVKPVPDLPKLPGDNVCLDFSRPTTLLDEVSHAAAKEFLVRRPDRFVLTGMMLFASIMDQARVRYIGSFPVNYSRWFSMQYRAVEFIFEDGTTVKFDGDVDTLVNKEVKEAFKNEVMSKGDVAITSIVFASIH